MAAAAQRQGRPRSGRVRWDRVGRTAMLFALAVLLYLAISPVRSLISDLHLSAERRAQLRELERVHASLVATERALRTRVTSEGEARNLGLVQPGEHEYIVTGLPHN